MYLAIVVLLLVCIAMPLVYAWRVLRLDEPSLGAWLLVVVDSTLFVCVVMLLARWDIAGLYTRYLLCGVFVAAVAWSLRRHWQRPWRSAGGRPLLRSHWTSLLAAGVSGALLVAALAGDPPAGERRLLAFPLADGRFVIAHGGGSRLLNHHAGHRAQRHALDISAVGAAGFRARGILPEALDAYAVYGAPVTSPCGGRVVTVANDRDDLAPGQTDAGKPAGNHVIIECAGMRVELAHLRKGSVRVAAGERVAAGQAIGEVGNSGNTTEPHLHLHAVDARTGVGVPLGFDAGTPVRNRVYAD